MSDSETIVCKPTRWFLFRAASTLLMFAVFSVLFYIDGSTGYRKKNEVFYLYKTFERAGNEFAQMNADQDLTADIWEMHASQQTVQFTNSPDKEVNPEILPADLELPMPWPEILSDYDKVKSLQWNKLWLEYSEERGFPASPSEHPYDARKIKEQWIVFYICIALAAINAFFLLRTLRRRIAADSEALTAADGRRIPYAELTQLDLRKWDTKGIAYAHYESPSGKGRIRIDGLTYGGFKKEQDEPAERLMNMIRSHFSGELLEYSSIPEPNAPDAPSHED